MKIKLYESLLLQKRYRHSSITTAVGYPSDFIYQNVDDGLEKTMLCQEKANSKHFRVFMGNFMGMPNSNSLQITPEILALVSKIDEFKGTWRALGQLAPEQLLYCPLLDNIVTTIKRAIQYYVDGDSTGGTQQ